MSSEAFAAASRMNPGDFTRKRSLPLPELVTFLLNLRKGANQDELDRFFEECEAIALLEAMSVFTARIVVGLQVPCVPVC